MVYDCKFRDNALKIRNSADPVIPKPGQIVPPFGGGPLGDGGILEMLSLANAPGEFEPADVERAAPAVPAPAPAAPPPSIARELPPRFLLTEGEQLARLDRDQCIVVVMMENRSYDHMRGDLEHVRVSPYVSAGAKNRTVLDHTSILETILVHNRERLSDDVLLGFR